ncbi:16S rRNA (cytosine(1402)-N(4))-methyltransferase RsmH [Candidatus Peregrinibacteria bacterium]|nr:16S rRNA (cytosine(1402)-N(4))-methyltransferase RsmH [Candidatus Peregrinibacteria bacterium]
MHIPVLLQEVIEYLRPEENQTFVDATLGLGGHAKEILVRTAPHGKLIGFEQDPRNLSIAKNVLKDFKDRVDFVPKNFIHFAEVLRELKIPRINGVLFDLGISSLHLDEAERGFSLRLNGPLDMRMDPEHTKETAALILNTFSEEALAHIFWKYGEVKRSGFYGRKITEQRSVRPFSTTGELADFISAHASPHDPKGEKHTVALIFQALRIAVNHELEYLEKVLPETLPFLEPSGRIAVISFHSLEDRIVKTFFNSQSEKEKNQKYPSKVNEKMSKAPLKLITRKCILPSRQESEKNPRARSARLRVAEKVL